MDLSLLKTILNGVKQGETDVDTALEKLKNYPFEDLGYVKIDHHRSLRKGFPEVIYCEGKSIEQIREIFQKLAQLNPTVMGTRASQMVYEQLKEAISDLCYDREARVIYVNKEKSPKIGKVAVVSAGTADLPVAQEAALTAELMGSHVERIYDVGVSGLHRLFSKLDQIMDAKVVVVVAGMEGALASVVGGLVDKPVIGVPTSVGYGTGFGGITPLLTMLNSCATGVSVVNIDNGFGAGYLAAMINKG